MTAIFANPSVGAAAAAPHGADWAVVTGHSRGLGRALAAGLLAQGWRVLGLSRTGWAPPGSPSPAGLVEVALDAADAHALAHWLASPAAQAAWHRPLAGARRAWLLNNAGTVHPMGPPGAQGAAAIAQAVALNLTAPLLLTDALVAATAAQADRRVVHVSSGAGRSAHAGWSIYGATKAALDAHARAVALDAVPNLRLESLAPGVVDTDMQAQLRATPAQALPGVARFVALHRDGQLATPQAVAQRLLAHLASARFGQEPVTDLRQLG